MKLLVVSPLSYPQTNRNRGTCGRWKRDPIRFDATCSGSSRIRWRCRAPPEGKKRQVWWFLCVFLGWKHQQLFLREKYVELWMIFSCRTKKIDNLQIWGQIDYRNVLNHLFNHQVSQPDCNMFLPIDKLDLFGPRYFPQGIFSGDPKVGGWR